MNCFPELTYSSYADGELAAEEARQVEAHLAACPRCRALVEGLRAETALLAAALEERDEAPVAAPARPLDIVWTALAVLAAAAGLQVTANWVEGSAVPAGFDWLNPLNLSGQLNLLFTSLFYVIREGATMIASSITTVSFLALFLLIVGAGVYLWRRRPAALAVLVTLLLTLLLASPAAALEHRKAETVTVPQGETLDDTLVAFGDTVSVDGTLTGNLIAFGKRVVVNGTVKGDVIAFAERIELGGTVEGNVITGSQFLTVRGQVDQSLHGFANVMELETNARVNGDAVLFVNTGQLNGSVGRDLALFSSMTDVRGRIGRNILARVERLTLLSTARVGGDLTVHAKKKASLHVDPGAQVAGQTQTIVPPPERGQFLQAKFYGQNAVGILIIFLIGLLLSRLFPALFEMQLNNAGAFLRTAGVGFLALVATPVAALLMAILLFGVGHLAGAVLIATLFPLLLVLVWMLAVYVAKVFVALFIGRALLKPAPGQPPRLALPLLLGLVIIYVAIYVPYVGGVLHFCVWLLGLGMICMQIYRHYWPRPAAA